MTEEDGDMSVGGSAFEANVQHLAYVVKRLDAGGSPGDRPVTHYAHGVEWVEKTASTVLPHGT